MAYRMLIAALCLVPTLLGSAASQTSTQQPWVPVQIGVPEVDFFGIWQTPSSVQIGWNDFLALRERRQSSNDCCYLFQYTFDTQLARRGPFGPTYGADVLVMHNGTVGGVNWKYEEGQRIGPLYGKPITLGDIRRLANGVPMTVTPMTGVNDDTAATYEFGVGARKIQVVYLGEGRDVIVHLRP